MKQLRIEQVFHQDRLNYFEEYPPVSILDRIEEDLIKLLCKGVDVSQYKIRCNKEVFKELGAFGCYGYIVEFDKIENIDGFSYKIIKKNEI